MIQTLTGAAVQTSRSATLVFARSLATFAVICAIAGMLVGANAALVADSPTDAQVGDLLVSETAESLSKETTPEPTAFGQAVGSIAPEWIPKKTLPGVQPGETRGPAPPLLRNAMMPIVEFAGAIANATAVVVYRHPWTKYIVQAVSITGLLGIGGLYAYRVRRVIQ